MGKLDGALTIDLEDWRSALNPNPHTDTDRRKPDAEYLQSATSMMIRELDMAGAKATFFVLGEVAEAVPEVIREISRSGHEIASHSSVHLPVGMVPRERLKNSLARDVALLEELAGTRPIGFRAPYLALKRADGWLLDILADLGFAYDSSVAPTWTPYWGIPAAPKRPYYPDRKDLARSAEEGRILEIPLTVWPALHLLPGLPIGGGFYMRIWPSDFLVWMMRRNLANGLKLVLYIHPGNLETRKERVPSPTVRDRISQYAFSGRGLSSFRRLMREFRFGTLRDVYHEEIGSIDREP